MNLPPLRLLSVFETVIRHGSIGAAAAELNVSQPAISQGLKELEGRLGARLLDRSTRPAGLTQAGRLLQRATADGLGRIAEAVEEIARLGAGADQAVTIACSVGVATYWLMPRLAIFYDQHPDISVNVRTMLQGDPPMANGVDLAIRYGDGKWDDGVVHFLMEERIDPVCSPALATRLKGSDWLGAASLIHVDVEDDRWLSWNAYLRATGQKAAKRRGLHFTNYVQATQAALSGQGVMLGWRSITGDLLKEGQLAGMGGAPLVPDDAFYLVAAYRPRSAGASGILSAWLIGLKGGRKKAVLF
jgi:LysR family glycine cleavage system transcriptional activator